jgi:hypothetical protein
MAQAGGVIDDAALPRLLYLGDVTVADTMAGEALLYRLLQFYPPEKLAVISGVRPGMPALPGVAYHHYGPMFPRLLHTRVAEEYVLWRAWRYYELPAVIERIATFFKPQAILSISHVSGWLAAWQLAKHRGVPFHLIAHDDLVYANRFPAWARAWAERKFGEAYRDADARFCISDAMEEIYRQRFGAPGQVMYPTYKGEAGSVAVGARTGQTGASLIFGYGGSINNASDMEQLIAFARAVTVRGHRLLVFSPQHDQLAARASAAGVSIDTRAPIHSAELTARFRAEADCLLLPQSMVEADRTLVATAFPTKWSDYSLIGLPVIVWAPPGSSSERFVREHPGCAELVVTDQPADLERAIAAIESSAAHRRSLAETLVRVGGEAFSPHAAWAQFSRTLAVTHR